MQTSELLGRLVAAGELRRDDDSPLVGQGPRAPVKQQVHQGVERHAVGDGVAAIEGMPLDVGSLHPEVATAQGCLPQQS